MTTALSVLYGVAGLLAIFLIGFAIVGETLRWTAVRRWWFTAALAVVLVAWLGSAALR